MVNRIRPYQGMSCDYIVEILQTAKKPTSFKDLNQILKFKKSLLMYLRFMEQKGLIKYSIDGKWTMYKTTKKGEKLIKLLCFDDKPTRNFSVHRHALAKRKK